MKTIRIMFVTAALAWAGSAALAQQGASAASGASPSAPRGMGMGPGMGPGPHGRWGTDFTTGWSMMSPQEREEHQAKMRSITTYEECKSYRAQHHQQMIERAKQQGASVPAQPRHDACANFKKP